MLFRFLDLRFVDCKMVTDSSCEQVEVLVLVDPSLETH